MKKTSFIAVLLALTTCLYAQKMTICEAFEQLTNQSADFSPMIGDPVDSLEISFFSTIEIDKAEESVFKKFLGAPTFKATYGSFQTENEALMLVEELKKQFCDCWGVFHFADKIDTIMDSHEYHFIQAAEGQFRVYEACFKINNWGDTYDVVFEYPQTEDNFLTGYTPSYTDYTVLPYTGDESAFAFSLKLILSESFEAFEGIKGDFILDPNNYFDRYEARYMPSGFENCYIEDRGLGIVFYTIPLCSNVEEAEFQELVQKLANQVFSALESHYGASASQDGSTITFVHKDNPMHRVGMLYTSVEDGLYSLTLILDAYR